MNTSQLLPICTDQKYGFVDFQGNIKIPPQWNYAGPFCEGIARVSLKKSPEDRNSLWGFIDERGRAITPCRFDAAEDFSQGRAAVNVGGQWKYVPYDDSWYFDGGAWGLIDAKGQWVVEPLYTGLLSFSEGFAGYRRGSIAGYVDGSGREVTWGEFSGTYSFAEGLAPVVRDQRYHYVNRDGHVVIKTEFELAWSFGEGLAPGLIRKSFKYVFINEKGEHVLRTPEGCNFATPFSHGLSAASSGGIRRMNDGQLFPLGQPRPFGFLDKTGAWKILPQFDYAHSFRGGLAQVRIDGKCGFIDTSGNLVIPLDLDGARDFDNGHTLTRRGRDHILFDHTGRQVWSG